VALQVSVCEAAHLGAVYKLVESCLVLALDTGLYLDICHRGGPWGVKQFFSSCNSFHSRTTIGLPGSCLIQLNIAYVEELVP